MTDHPLHTPGEPELASTLRTDEYEVISSEEVDRVVEALEDLTETVESDNIRTYLDEAVNNIFYLVYDEGDLIEEDGGDLEAA